MSRFCRWTFNIAGVLSLLLFVAIAALWMRSIFREDWWWPPPQYFGHRVFESRGGALVVMDYEWKDRLHWGYTGMSRTFLIPYFALLVVFGFVAGWFLASIVRRRRRRINNGHCSKCGYNLTGNVSGVCPECGL